MSEQTRRFTRGAGFIYAYRWIDRLLGFVSVAVLARILLPEDFGLVAIAASYVAIVEGLSEFDVQRALIQSRSEEREVYDSAFTLSLLRGVLAALAMLLVSPFVSDSRISTILYVLAVVPLLQGLCNPRFVLFERSLVYSPLAVTTLVAKLVSFGLTLWVAFAYRSYWALVVGIVAASLVTLILTYGYKPYRPRLSLSRYREILSFSGWMSLANMVTTVSMRTDQIIIGRLLGIVDSGLYYMTQRIGVLPTSELISPLQRILFPSFSEIADDQVRLRRVVQESVNVLGSLSLPAAVGFALLANDFVPLVLGERWVTIVPLLVVLVPYLGLRATTSMTQPCVMALGRTRLMFRVSVVYALVHLPLFIAGTALYGLPGAIWGIVLAGFFYIYLNAWLLQVTLEITMVEILAQLRRPFLSTLVMAGAILALDRIWSRELFAPEGSWQGMSIKLAVGMIVFVATQAALWRLEGKPAGIERRLLELLSR